MSFFRFRHSRASKIITEDFQKAATGDMDREHNAKEATIHDLFREVILPLLAVRFDSAQYTTVLTDRYGKFTLDNSIHRYSVSPAFSRVRLNLRIASSEVLVMDSEYA